MNQPLLNMIEGIEEESHELTQDYQKKMTLVRRESEQRIEDARKNMEQSLVEYEQELQVKQEQKLAVFKENTKQNEIETIALLKERFEKNEQDFIQMTIKEVLLRYGNR